MLRVLELPSTPLAGVLYIHFDMWLNPRSHFATHAPLGSMWMPKNGLDRYTWETPVCARPGPWWASPRRGRSSIPVVPESELTRGNISRPTPTWSPPHPARFAAQKLLGNACDQPTWMPSLPGAIRPGARRLRECCWAWSDLIYVPSSALAGFVQLAAGPLATLFHEVAVPTAMSEVHAQLGVPWIDVSCIGDCCSKRWPVLGRWPEEALSLCGHRLDLTKATHRLLLKHTLSSSCAFPKAARSPMCEPTAGTASTSLR